MCHQTTYWKHCLFSSPVLDVFVRDLFPLLKTALAIQGILLSKWTITSFHLIGSSAGLTVLINPCRQMYFILCSLVLLFYVLSLVPTSCPSSCCLPHHISTISAHFFSLLSVGHIPTRVSFSF